MTKPTFTIERIIDAVRRAHAKACARLALDEVDGRPRDSTGEEDFHALLATAALLRKIAEPSDEDLDAAESVRDGVLASEPVRRDMGVTARRNAMRAALATLNQPAPTEDKA